MKVFKWGQSTIALLVVFVAVFNGSKAHAETFTLQQALSLIKQNGVQSKVHALRIKAAEAQIKKDWSILLPNLELIAERVHNDLRGTRAINTGPPLNGEDPLNLAPVDARRARLYFSQTVFDMKIPTQIGLSNIRLGAAHLDSKRSSQEEQLKVVESFYAVAEQQYLKDLAKKKVDLFKNHLIEVENKFARKLQTKNDVLKIKVELLKGEEELVESRQNLALEKLRLNHLLNRPSEATINVTDNIELALPKDMPDSEDLLSESLKNRPDMLRREKERQYITGLRDIEFRRWWPTFAFTGSFGYTKKGDFDFNGNNRDWTWALVGTVKILDRLQGFWEGEILKAQEKEVIIIQKALKKEVKTEIEENLFIVNLNQKRYQNYQAKIESASENLRVTEGKFRHKKATRVDVLYARTERIKAQSEGEISRIELKKSIYKLMVSLGKTPSELI